MTEENKSAPTITLTNKVEIPPMEPLKIDSLKKLKEKADLLGITYSNNIGEDALREKINDKINGEAAKISNIEPEAKDDVVDQNTLPLNEVTDEAVLRRRIYEDSMHLVRVRIANLNPAKKDIPGEWVTVHNKYLGSVRKYIPFGEATDGGYHVPKIILDVLKSRKFINMKVKKGNFGSMTPTTMWVKEFSIEELPPLTQAELDQLARQQAAARGM